jgi:hypothetical protein
MKGDCTADSAGSPCSRVGDRAQINGDCAMRSGEAALGDLAQRTAIEEARHNNRVACLAQPLGAGCRKGIRPRRSHKGRPLKSEAGAQRPPRRPNSEKGDPTPTAFARSPSPLTSSGKKWTPLEFTLTPRRMDSSAAGASCRACRRRSPIERHPAELPPV